jgi:D-3-phosphoglycerate dehydrogenase
VNVAKGETATHLLVVRHADRVGVLAHVLAVLREEGISVQEMENVVLGGAKAAIAQIAVDKAPSAEAILAMKQNSNVFDVSAVAIQR